MNSEIKNSKIKILFWAISTAYVILSAMKVKEGAIGQSLIASYEYAARTDIVYSIVIAITVLTISCFIFNKLGGSNKVKWVEYFDSYLFILWLISYVIDGTLGNMQYCIIYCASMFLAGICTFMSSRRKKMERKNVTREDLSWHDWKEVGLPFCFWLLPVGICIPVELYINNPGDFEFLFWHYFFVLVVWTAGLLLGAVIISIVLLDKKQFVIVSLLLFSISAIGYIQGVVLNRNLNVLDGDIQKWSVGVQIVNAAIWIAGIVLIFYLRYRIPQISKFYRVICVYLILVQLISTGYLIVTRDADRDSYYKAFTNKGALEIDRGKNVIVLLMDRFDAELLEQIMQEDEAFTDPLRDFTFYPNATCEFGRTRMAIPYMLTGVEWKDDISEGYPVYAYKNSDFLQQVSQNGYELAIYTNEDFVEEEYRKGIRNYDEHFEQKCSFWDTFDTMSKCSKYRIAPICLKNRYVYYSNDIKHLITNKEAWNTDDDYPFYQSLIGEGLSLKPDSGNIGTFYFYHFFGPHGPYNMSEEMKRVSPGSITQIEQARADLKIAYEYIKQLKALGKYDDATIIITADHGIQLDEDYYLDEGMVDRTTIPLVLVKYPNKVNDKLQINEAPVSQANFVPTLLEAMGIEHETYGRTFEEVPINDTIERYYMIDEYKFEIKGDARIKDNWKLID